MKNLKNLNPKNIRTNTKKIMRILGFIIVITAPMIACASVESSLAAVQDKVVGTLLPLAAMCGLAYAGLSFVAGQPNARTHLIYAIIGAAVGFGAESIISLVRSLVQ